MKKCLHFLICSGLILSTSLITHAFEDVSPTDWHYTYVTAMTDQGYLYGKSEEVFQPDGTLTLAEFSVMLANGFYGETLAQEREKDTSFWWEPYLSTVDARQGYGFVSGAPDQEISRYDMAEMVYHLMKDRDLPLISEETLEILHFVDEVSPHATLAVANAVSEGILSGRSDGRFDGEATLTRGEAAVTLYTLVNHPLISTEKWNESPTDSVESTENPTESEEVQAFEESDSTEEAVLIYNMPADTNKDGAISDSEIQAVFARYEAKYPQGYYWTNDTTYFTKLPTINDAGASFTVNLHAAGCAAWVYLLGNDIFGNAPQYEISKEQAKMGDYWHTGTHWGMIQKVNGDGSFDTCEGNMNSAVYWNYTRNASYFSNAQFYSRHPQM